jgi:hypothetical protein
MSPMSKQSESAASECRNAQERCSPLRVSIPEASVLYRHLGYPAQTAPAPQITQRISEIIPNVVEALEPRGVFVICPVSEKTTRTTSLGVYTIQGEVCEYIASADRIAVFVVTVGEAISIRAQDVARDGDAVAAWIVDAFGSWAVEAAADALTTRIRQGLPKSEALTPRYSPGYCGMDISQQRTLFDIVDADSIGVTLLPSLFMTPSKSVSGIIGIGPKERVSENDTPCNRCQRIGCHMRR